MKFILFFCGLFLSQIVFGQLTNEEIRYLKSGLLKPDTSFIYSLPYRSGSRFLFIQGANSKMSHKNELAYDFKMRKYSKVCAARAGVVIEVKEDSDKGGLKDEYLSEGNHIIIKHGDGSEAQYWHLSLNGSLVEVGDSVKQGQDIGYSGNTGYTAFPHLHFQVIDANGKEILVRFKTRKGIKYIRPGKWYRGVR
ncbi:M23 family metallopeptidase [Ferruginibacter sp. SUN002]|uniref:M23 family metallopeptidase n=1 Tax=Ferruginibacter sp. SUN002 TaxID=2937789 RepID=UPI003D361A27